MGKEGREAGESQTALARLLDTPFLLVLNTSRLDPFQPLHWSSFHYLLHLPLALTRFPRHFVSLRVTNRFSLSCSDAIIPLSAYIFRPLKIHPFRGSALVRISVTSSCSQVHPVNLFLVLQVRRRKIVGGVRPWSTATTRQTFGQVRCLLLIRGLPPPTPKARLAARCNPRAAVNPSASC
jgi:hypothetical protein